jgi:hypothetical protein
MACNSTIISYKEKEYCVYSKDIDRFWGKVSKGSNNECWIWNSAINGSGYGSIKVNHKVFGAHCFSYLLNKGEIPNNLVIRHICNNKLCVNPNHLSIGTAFENVHDTISQGRNCRGADSKTSKLKESDIIQIRDIYSKTKVSQAKLAKVFGVSKGVICRIITGQDWSHIGGKIRNMPFNMGDAKLLIQEVLEIRRLYSLGVKAIILSKMFLVTSSSISNIINHKTWKNI